MTELEGEYRFLSVCSGIEAFSVAVTDLDFAPVAFAEIEDFPSKVLKYHYPDVPNLGDMTKIDTAKLGRIDWLVGGTPCQSFSVAGLRHGLADDRGNLSLEYVRLAHELAAGNGLRGLLWENVPGVLSDKTNALGCFLGALVGHDAPLYPGDKPRYGRSSDTWKWVRPGVEPILDDEGEATGEFEEVSEGYHRPKWPDAGMVAGPRARLAWRILDSKHFGVAQRRRRVFVVADFGNGPDPAAVLFEPRGQGWSAAAGGETRQEVAGTIAPSLVRSGRGVERTGDSRGQDPLIVSNIAPTLRAGGNKTGGHRPPGSDVDTVETLVVYSGNAEGGNSELPSINASNGKKGINNQTPLVSVTAFSPQASASQSMNPAEVTPSLDKSKVHAIAFGSKDHGADAGELSPTLKASGHFGSHANGGAPPAVAFNYQMGSKARGIGDVVDGSPTMTENPNIAVALALRGREGGNMPELGGEQANALRGADGGSSAPMAMAGMQVRRLTPEECEKLQGFPVGWTRIPGLSGWRTVGQDEDIDELRAAGLTVKIGKTTRVNDPDGPRYKALGNSFTTEPVNWIMCRVQASMRGEPMPPWQPMQLWAKPSQ